MTRRRISAVVAVLATLAIVVPLTWMWWSSRMPDAYNVMDMGYADYGGGPRPAEGHGSHGAGATTDAGVSVEDLRGEPEGAPDVRVELVAAEGTVSLPSGRTVDGFTVNGTSPGPVVEATAGDLVEVRFRNESVADGATLHWHGVDVPNGEDGVAGVTQDAVMPGEEFVYRFVAEDPGTYWYHSHQVSHEQVVKGLFGALVVQPRDGVDQDVEAVAVTHTFGDRTLNGLEGDVPVVAEPGDTVRLRVVNTDNALVELWADAPYRVLAIDGFDLTGPTPVEDQALTLTAGARADLEVTVPDTGAVRVQVGGATSLVVGPDGVDVPPAPEQPESDLDLLTYGTPAGLPFDVTDPDRRFDYAIGRRPGFVNGRPGLWWSINGRLFPDVPMFVVEEGDVAVFRIENDSGESHPMHLHGHHAVVLSRNGEASTGSPWWVDSLEVASGDEYEIAFVADNPGVWMDHCHNLPHAKEGLVAHLMYAGVTTPYEIGPDTGNTPE
ncbi:multicopper oxidase family protein [Nocardioides sp. HDW12B]|uniref:multicopper oxidase family protein n=1 Tax=Nocardioides sp. HDW12B TaxID=2714939 RepID=UPI00140C9EA2|nr:multicopper oxidase family protein [Nocardioides sp. HDW12B]QIK67602.1 multicopper oxidase family protein [Nocardioides sp. HDW12B]